MVQDRTYNFSFTGASALVTETIIVVQEYLRLKDWDLVKSYIEEHNLLNKIKRSTFEREFREIKKRVETLSPEQQELLIHSGIDEAKQMVLLAIIKRYPYIHDFVVEVMLNKWLIYDRVLQDKDYNSYCNTKKLSHPELESITQTTELKVKQRVFRILQEVGLITDVKDGFILKPILNNEIERAIVNDNPNLLLAYFYTVADIHELTKKYEYV